MTSDIPALDPFPPVVEIIPGENADDQRFIDWVAKLLLDLAEGGIE